MPIYTFTCGGCGHKYTSSNPSGPPRCPNCGAIIGSTLTEEGKLMRHTGRVTTEKFKDEAHKGILNWLFNSRDSSSEAGGGDKKYSSFPLGFFILLIFIAFFVSLFFVALTNLTILWVVLGIFSFITSAFIISNNKFQKDQKGFMDKKFPVISILVLVMSFTFVLGANNVGAKLPSLFKITDTEVRPSLIGTMSVAKGTLTSKYALLGAGPNKFLSQ